MTVPEKISVYSRILGVFSKERLKLNGEISGFLFLLLTLFGPLFINLDLPGDRNLIARLLFLSVCFFTFVIYFQISAYRDKSKYDLTIFKKLVFPVYLAFLLIVALSFFKALNISEALWEWFKTFAFLAYFALLSLLFVRIKSVIPILTKIMIVYSVVILLSGAYDIVMLILVGKLNIETAYSLGGGFSYKNVYSQMLLLVLPFSLYGVFCFRRLWRTASSLAIVFSLILITLLMTRSVWFALLAACVSYSALIMIFANKLSISKKVVRNLLIYAMVLFIVLTGTILIYSKFDSRDTFAYKVKEILNFKQGSASTRLQLWDNTLDLIRDNPILGVGAGNWKLVYPKYSGGIEYSSIGRRMPQRPHNDFLWVMAETGPIGMALYLLVFLISTFYVYRIIKYSVELDEKIFISLMYLGIISYLIISFFSFPKERIEIMTVMHIILAIIVCVYHTTFKTTRSSSKPGVFKYSIPVSIILLAMIILTTYKLNAKIHMEKAKFYKNNKMYYSTISQISKGYTMFTNVDETGYPLLGIRGIAHFELGHYKAALKDYIKASKANPYNISVLHNLALTYGKTGDIKKSENILLNTLEFCPNYENGVINLCVLYINSKRIEEAYELINTIKPKTNKQKYNEILMTILKYKADKLISNLDERKVINVLRKKSKIQKWIRRVHQRALIKNITFEKQLLLKSIHILEKVNWTIGKQEADSLRAYYRLNN